MRADLDVLIDCITLDGGFLDNMDGVEVNEELEIGMIEHKDKCPSSKTA